MLRYHFDLTPIFPHCTKQTKTGQTMSGEGLKQRKGGKKEEEKTLLDKEDKAKPAVRFLLYPWGGVVWCVGGAGLG